MFGPHMALEWLQPRLLEGLRIGSVVAAPSTTSTELYEQSAFGQNHFEYIKSTHYQTGLALPITA
jgi:hypothetical protein